MDRQMDTYKGTTFTLNTDFSVATKEVETVEQLQCAVKR